MTPSNYFEFSFPQGLLSVNALTPHLLRVRWAAGAFAPRRSWDVTKAPTEFLPFAVKLDRTDQKAVLNTGLFRVEIDRSTGTITCFDAKDRPFCADVHAPYPSQEVAVVKRIEAGEHFYGFGERGGARLERSGRRWVNWATDPAHSHGPDVDPMYMAVPVYTSVRPGLAYSVFYNNTFYSEFDLSDPAELRFEARGGEIDYTICFGPTPAEALEALSELLGRMPLPPRWALGYHQSRWSYGSQDEVLKLAREFRARRIPCDVIHLDIDYMDGYRDFTWNRERFPDPPAMLGLLGSMGFKVVTIIDAGVKIDPAYEVYRSGLQKDVFIRKADGELANGYVWPDDSVFCDYLRPDVRAFWAERVQALARQGVRGIWCDMNEPVLFDKPFSQGGGGIGTLPLDAVQGPAGERTTHAEAHNLFGLGMARATYEGLKQANPSEQPFVLSRSGFAGIQRWSASWMGDNDSWWEHLEMSLPQMMNMSLSGVPFTGVDIGGFGNNASGELFARWMQIGALYPFCRGHSSIGTRQQEPWAFGPQVEAICRSALNLRYRSITYLYNLFQQASLRGLPIFRPLLYDFPDDPAVYELHDEVMIGPALLAAPILRPGQRARAVYLPQGEWRDRNSGERIQGGRWIMAEAPLERMPLYQRAGWDVPIDPEVLSL